MTALILPSNVGVAVVARTNGVDSSYKNFMYIGVRYGKYMVTFNKAYATKFFNCFDVQVALDKLNTNNLDTYELYLYTPSLNSESLVFMAELDKLVDM